MTDAEDRDPPVNTRRSFILFALGSVVGLGIAGYGLFTAEGTRTQFIPPQDVALVNQRHVLMSDFIAQVQVVTSQTFEHTTREQRLQTLNDMIHEELLVQRGLELDLAASDADVRQALVTGVQVQVEADTVAHQPSEEELQAYYQAHMDRYRSEGSMQLRDFVLDTAGLDKEAALAKARAAAAALREAASIDDAAAAAGLKESGNVDNGDQFDFAVRARLGQPVFDAAARLNTGEVSDPLEVDGAIHIIAMVKRTPPRQNDFATARSTVFQDLKRDAIARVEEGHLKYLRDRADILIVPEYRQ